MLLLISITKADQQALLCQAKRDIRTNIFAAPVTSGTRLPVVIMTLPTLQLIGNPPHHWPAGCRYPGLVPHRTSRRRQGSRQMLRRFPLVKAARRRRRAYGPVLSPHSTRRHNPVEHVP